MDCGALAAWPSAHNESRESAASANDDEDSDACVAVDSEGNAVDDGGELEMKLEGGGSPTLRRWPDAPLGSADEGLSEGIGLEDTWPLLTLQVKRSYRGWQPNGKIPKTIGNDWKGKTVQ